MNIKYKPSKLKSNPIYRAWCDMKTRCSNPNYNEYHRYGGRGISYDPIWEKFKNFERDIGTLFTSGLSLDRIDNNKGYSKENCRWATRKEQANNRKDSRLFTYHRMTKTLGQWAIYLGIKRSTLAQRLYVYKWPFDRVVKGGKRFGR